MDAEERETMRMLGQLKRENDALKAENAKLLKLLEGFRCGECGNVAVRASNISLVSENAKLREALGQTADVVNDGWYAKKTVPRG